MMTRLTQYLSALIFLIATACIYQSTFTPWIAPPVVESVAIKPSALLRADDSIKDLFAVGSWQRGSCKQLQTSQGMLLFQKWEQTADDHWKLWPITVVIGRGLGADRSDDPIIIDAAEGAELKFTESLDVLSGGAPPIEWGRMIGQVRIFRAGDDPDHPTLDLRTANVGIDNRKIWTTEAIQMQFGDARMVGRDLTIHLAGAATSGLSSRGASSRGASSRGGASSTAMDRMELIYLDSLVMPMRARDGSPPAMISLVCGGRVEYDFAIDQLMLYESVSLIHQPAGLPADRFDCQQLELMLNDPSNESIVRTSPMDWLIRVVATGTPAVANLPTRQTEIAADYIELDALAGIIRAEGQRGIRVRRGGVKASLARLIYQFDPKHPDAIGVIDADGAGIVTVDDPKNPVRRAQWTNGFHLRPVGVATAKNFDADAKITIEGDVKAWMVDGGEFAADEVRVSLTPTAKRVTNVSSAVAVGQPDQASTLVPEWVEILGRVRIATTAVAAEADHVWLNFIDEEDPRPKSVDAATGAPSPAGGIRQWVAQPTDNGPTGNGPPTQPVARPRPVIRGDSINAQLRRNASGLSAKTLGVIGNVVVEHVIEAGGQMLPAKLTGQQLQLEDNRGDDVLQLSGTPLSPARFELGDGFFVGPKIQIWPSNNVVWIDSAGEFQMPTAALPTGLAAGSGANAGNPATNSGSVSWTKPPHCRWQGEMTFDGKTVTLTDGVDIRAELVSSDQPWDIQLSGDRLEVELQDSVEMRDVASIRQATVRRITMLQGDQRPVVARAIQRAGDGVLEAKHLIYARSLTMSPSAGGLLTGAGPGWYRGWSVGGGTNPFAAGDQKPAPSAALVSDSTMIDDAKRDLTGIHLTFNDSMQVDMTNRSLDFLRGVRVGIQPVNGWDQAFDAAKMDAITVGQSTLDCDRLRFAVEPALVTTPSTIAGFSGGRSTAWEMEAISGVVFRTRNDQGLLECTAARAAYSSSKDKFIIDGAPNRPAIFRRTNPDGSPGIEGAVRTTTIRPRTMQLEDTKLERIGIAVPGGSANR